MRSARDEDPGRLLRALHERLCALTRGGLANGYAHDMLPGAFLARDAVEVAAVVLHVRIHGVWEEGGVDVGSDPAALHVAWSSVLTLWREGRKATGGVDDRRHPEALDHAPSVVAARRRLIEVADLTFRHAMELLRLDQASPVRGLGRT